MVDRNFRVVSVERVDAPGGASKEQWHHYIVENDLTQIDGYAPGSRRTVTSRAKEYVTQLNARNDPTTARGPWTTQSRQKKKAAASSAAPSSSSSSS